MTLHGLPRLTYHEKQRILDAGNTIRRLLPGLIGDLVADELQFRVDQGHALGPDARTWRLVAAIEELQRQREQETV